MAEPKRIAVTQIGAVKPQEKREKRRFAHRFTLCLDRSTEKTCPEFSFNDLLKNALGDVEEHNDPDDPFSHLDQMEHDRLEAMAKSFEEKYAPPKPKKKKKGPYNRIQEFVDLGDGYDEADPFIDNTEAYDELVPSCLTTQHGGFYINSGKLDFRAVSDSDDDFQITTKKKHKKNLITSDSDSGSQPKKRGPKKKFSAKDELRKRKRKKLASTDSIDKSLHKRKKFDRDGYKGLKLKKKKKNAGGLVNVPGLTPNGIAASTINGSKPEKTSDAPDITPMSTEALQNMESAIDSVISQSRKMDVFSSEVDGQSMSPKPLGSHNTNPQSVPGLPDPLPPRIQDLVSKLKQAASDSEKGIKKFFNPEVNQMLLQLETGSRQLPSSIRNAIYNHLAACLPCGKETLIKRAKKLCMDQHEEKLKEPIAKLKEAINKAMPSLIDKHQVELQTIQQMKIERKQEHRDAGSTESDEDGEKPEGDKQKRIMAPRKKFEWSYDLRSLLNQIVLIEMNHFEVSRIRSQTPEQYLKSFLEQEVKSLWPQGWIQTRMLFKECKAVHQRWTNPGYRPRKPLTMTTGSHLNSLSNSAPSTPVNVAATSSLLMTTTKVISAGDDTKQLSSVQKQSSDSMSGSSSDSSYCSSDDSSNPVTKTILDYAGDQSNGIAKALESQPVVVLNKASVKPELKPSGSTGFVPTVSSERSATQVMHHITASLSTAKPPPIIVPAVCKQTEESTKTFLETFYQFAASSQSVSSTTGEVTQLNLAVPPVSMAVVDPHQSKHKQTVTTANTLPRASSTTPKTESRPINTAIAQQNVGKNTMKPQDLSGRGISPSSKPHLAAALQGMYFPTTTVSSCISQQASHSQLSSTTKTQVMSQGQKIVGYQIQKQAPSSTSSVSQIKVLEQSRSSSVAQTSRQHVTTHYANSSSGVGSLQQNSVSPNQIRVSQTSNCQKQVSSTTNPPSQSNKGITHPDATNRPAKKFQVTAEGLFKLKADLAHAVSQRAIKAQEKTLGSLEPKQTGPLQMVNPSSVQRTNQIQAESSQSGPKQASPVAQPTISQKVMTPVPQSLGHLSSVIPRSQISHNSQQSPVLPRTQASHSTQNRTKTDAHSVVSQQTAMFAVPSPVTSVKTFGVNQVSSTSGARSSQVQDYRTMVTNPATDYSQSTHRSMTDHKKQASQNSGAVNKPAISHSQAHAQSTGRPSSLSQTVAVRPTFSVTTEKTPSTSSVQVVGKGPTHSSHVHALPALHSTSNRVSPSSHSKTSHSTSQSPQVTSNRQLSATQEPNSRATSSHVTTSKVQSFNTQTTRTSPSQPAANCGTPLSTYKISTYPPKSSPQSRPDSTSLSRGSEPKFGGLTLSQIQEQTLKASQKAHIQSAQYAAQAASTSPVYRSSESASVYGSAQLTNYSSPPPRSSPSVQGYNAMTPPSLTHPTSPNLQQSPELHQAASALYGMSQNPQVQRPSNTSTAPGLFPSVPIRPRASLLPYNLLYTDPSQRRY